MGVGLVRSLQPPDILWIHWRVYNSIANTSKWVLFLPPCDVYVRSFLYLLYTWIKLYYTKTLSDQASSLAPDWILLQRPRIPASLCGSATIFQYVKESPDKQFTKSESVPFFLTISFANLYRKSNLVLILTLTYLRNY